MKKKEIESIVKKIDLVMSKPEKLTFLTKYPTNSKTKMNTFTKLTEAIMAKGYNVIVLLSRDSLLLYDVKKQLYFISSYDIGEMLETAEKIFIDKNTVVLVHDVLSKYLTKDEMMTFYSNFQYTKGRQNTKMVFYSIREKTNNVFSTYISLESDMYSKMTKESIMKHPEYTYIYQLQDMRKEYSKRNAFVNIVRNFIGKNIDELFTNYIASTDENFYEYYSFNYLGIDVDHDERYELNADEFKEFIIDVFDDGLKPYYNYNLSLFYEILKNEITYLVMDQIFGISELEKKENISLDSKLLDDGDGVEFICYENEGITKHNENYKVLHSDKFTFAVLYKYMLDNTKNEFAEMVEDFDEKDDNYFEDMMDEEDDEISESEINFDEMKFPISANNKSSDLEKFYIFIEKAIYRMDRWMKLPDLEKLHQKHFERNSLRNLLYKKRELKVDLFRRGLTTLMKESIEEKAIHEIESPTAKQRLAVLLIACADNKTSSVENTKNLYNQYKFEIVISKMAVSGSINGIEIELEYYLKSEKDNKLTISLTEDIIVDNINDINFK